MKELNSFISADKDRRAIVYECKQGHKVECYQESYLVRTILLPDKSIHYAEDTAENWVTGIIQ